MGNSFRSLKLAASLAAMILLPGCFGGPSSVKIPPINPSKAAGAAMSQYDTNSDGLLSGAELEKCPALKKDLKALDQDGDSKVSEDELTARLDGWLKGRAGASMLNCRVTKGGRGLDGALVQMVPEEFLTDMIQPAEGTTDRGGVAQMAMDSSNLPADMKNFRAVQQGYYRVKITHPSTNLPAKYNTESELGLVISFDTGKSMVTFKL